MAKFSLVNDLGALKAEYLAKVDADFLVTRALSDVHAAKYVEACGEAPPRLLAAEAEAMGIPLDVLIAQVLAAHERDSESLVALEVARRRAKMEIRGAGSAQAAYLAYQNFTKSLASRNS